MMLTQKIQIKKLDPKATVPVRAYENDAGLDLYALDHFELKPNVPVKVKTGIAMAIPVGFVGLICDRSSMGSKGVRTLGGVVDAGYRGDIGVLLINLTVEPMAFKAGDKIAQLLVMPVHLGQTEETNELPDSQRGAKGFGSSGN